MKKVIIFILSIFTLVILNANNRDVFELYSSENPGKALSFDGINDYAAVQHTDIGNPTGDFTIELWTKLNNTPSGDVCLISKHANIGGNRSGYFMEYDSVNGIYAGIGNNSGWGIAYGTTWEIDEWHHIAMTFDTSASVLKLFDNGIIQDSTVVESISFNQLNLTFGASEFYGNYFPGIIDEIRMWDEVRTSQELLISRHLSISIEGNNLKAYWQFNEDNNQLQSCTGGYNVELFNSTANIWIDSTIPYGFGFSEINQEANGQVNFETAGLLMDYSEASSGDILVTKIKSHPNVIAESFELEYDSAYWVIDRFAEGNFQANLTFTLDEDVLDYDENHLSLVNLYRRSALADSNWIFVGTADAIDAVNDKITFNNITDFGQFVIGKPSDPEIELDAYSLAFNKVYLGNSRTLNLLITNQGSTALYINEISIDDDYFLSSITESNITPGQTQVVEITYEPELTGEDNAILSIFSNDDDEAQLNVSLNGHAYSASVLMVNGLEYSLEDSDLANMDIGYKADPVIYDIDNDGLLDMLIGELNGNLNHFEQSEFGSDNFQYIRWNFNDIDVGSSSSPCITDIDNDGLLDLIIGENYGNLNLYEQTSINSYQFEYITSNFANLIAIDGADPYVVDIDNDGLLDLLVGGENGRIRHLEQDSENSYEFSLISNQFSGIDVGSNASPYLFTQENESELNMYVGNYYGLLKHYKQDSSDPYTFTLIENNLTGIDYGYTAKPCVYDINNDLLPEMFVGNYDGFLSYLKINVVSDISFNILEDDYLIKEYDILGINLSSDVSIACPRNFSISNSDNGPFTNNLTLNRTNIDPTTKIYVRFQSENHLSIQDYIYFNSEDAEDFSLQVRGEKALSDNYAGSVLYFDGDNDYVEIPDSSVLDFTTNYSLEAWVKLNSLGVNQGIISKYHSSGANGYFLRINDSKIIFDGMETSSDIINIGQWYHIVAVNDGGIRYLYLNGEEVALSGSAISIAQNNDPLCLGVDFLANGRFFNGWLDEVCIWDRSLSVSEIRENMYRGLISSNGLIGYFQMNEDAGNEVMDIFDNVSGTLIGSQENNYLNSDLHFGNSVSEINNETEGWVIFENTNVKINCPSTNDGVFSVTKFDITPNILPENYEEIYDQSYWVINKYDSDGGNYDITFTLEEDITEDDLEIPIVLNYRENGFVGEWRAIKTSQIVDYQTNEITFTDLSYFGQFIITKKYLPTISCNTSTLDFEVEKVNNSKTMGFMIYNTGLNVLNISEILTNSTNFVPNMNAMQVNVSDSVYVEVTFTPTSNTSYESSLTIVSDDAENPEYLINLYGIGREPDLKTIDDFPFELAESDFLAINEGMKINIALDYIYSDWKANLLIGRETGDFKEFQQSSSYNGTSYDFNLYFSNLDNVDIGNNAVPLIYDIDNDGYLDLLVGEETGNINHFEKNGNYEAEFTLITDTFSGITIGSYLHPTIGDIDNDGLLDLLLGVSSGTIYHYEQSSENSYDFDLISSSFNSIDIGNYSKPYLSDFNLDGLWDLLIGTANTNLYYYQQDSENSNEFNLQSSSVLDFDSGSFLSPACFDINKDGFMDMLLGNGDGLITRLQTDYLETLNIANSRQAKSFLLVANNLIDNVEINCSPGFLASLQSGGNYNQNLIIPKESLEKSLKIFIKIDQNYQGVLSGTIDIDTYGYSHQIEIEGRNFFPDNTAGNCLEFDGINDYVRIEDDNSIDLINNYTLEAWIKINDFTRYGGIISKYHSSGSDGYFLRLSGTEPYNGLSFDSMNSESNILSLDEWYHVAAVNNNGNRSLYLNGEKLTLSGNPLNVQENSDPLCIGLDYLANGRHFSGCIDEVRIWDIARDSLQIRENMYKHLTLEEENLISYWQANEESGTDLYDYFSGNDGILVDMGSNPWLQADFPFGPSQTSSNLESYGIVDFSPANLVINFNNHNSSAITVTRIDTTANVLPITDDIIIQDSYWVINRFSEGNLSADLQFIINENLASYESEPSSLHLYSRESNSNSSWSFVSEASSVSIDENYVQFADISEFGQFIIVREINLDSYAGSCLSFDGINDYIEINDDSSFNSNSFTIEFWMRPNELGVQHLFHKRSLGDGSPAWRIFMSGSTGSIELDAVPGEIANCKATSIAQVGEWLHIVGVYDNSMHEVRLYANGELMDQVNNIYNFGNSTDKGYTFSKGGYYYNGLIDEVRLWNVVRSEEEIREYMYLPLSGHEPGLVSYWQLNNESNNVLEDKISLNSGQLTDIAGPIVLESSIPFGQGYSDSQSETSGLVDFNNTGLFMNFDLSDNADITVTRIDTTANINPSEVDYVFEQPYWIINRYGFGSFNADLVFNLEGFSQEDFNNPSQIALFTRVKTSADLWSYSCRASNIDLINNQVTFQNISTGGQFIITRWNSDIETPQNVMISRDNDTFTITWDPVNGAGSYSIFASINPNGDYEEIASGINTTEWTGTLSSNMKFYYVQASTENANRFHSNGVGVNNKSQSKQ